MAASSGAIQASNSARRTGFSMRDVAGLEDGSVASVCADSASFSRETDW